MTLHFFRMSQQEPPAVLRRTIRLLNIYEENQRKQQQPITIGIINEEDAARTALARGSARPSPTED